MKGQSNAKSIMEDIYLLERFTDDTAEEKTLTMCSIYLSWDRLMHPNIKYHVQKPDKNYV